MDMSNEHDNKDDEGDKYNENTYLIIVTGTTGGACVKIFCPV